MRASNGVGNCPNYDSIALPKKMASAMPCRLASRESGAWTRMLVVTKQNVEWFSSSPRKQNDNSKRQ
eukprot:5947218-Amphidinium_carterae.1